MFISCGKDIGRENEAAIFRMNLYMGLSTLDPAYAKDLSSGWMCKQLFSNLVTFDAELNIIPELAVKWEVKDSGKTYVFQLRTDATFHESPYFNERKQRKVRAKDFVYSFHRIVDPGVASPGAWIFNERVEGVAAFRQGKATSVSGFYALNDSVLCIRLREPFAPFLGILAMPYASVVPEEVVRQYGKDFRNHPIGSGPFRFKSWREDQSLILLRNQNYFEQDCTGHRLPYLEAVHVRFIRSRSTEFVEFLQGKLDFINGLDHALKDEVLNVRGEVKEKYMQDYEVYRSPQLNTEFLAFLSDSTDQLPGYHPLRDKRVRKAIGYAIDRKRLVKYLLNNNAIPAHAGIIPEGMPGFKKGADWGFTYAPDKAMRLLEEAGYPQGEGIPVLTLSATPEYTAVMEYIQKSLEKVGLQVSIDNMKGGALRERAASGSIRFWRASWVADYPDGENYLALFYSKNIPPNGANRMRFISNAFDRSYEAACGIVAPKERYLLYQKMDSLQLSEVPIIPLYYDRIFRISQKNISNLYTNAMNMLSLKRVKKQ